MSRHSPSSLESGVAGLSLGGSGGRPSSSSPFSNPRPAHSSSPSSNDDSAYETGGGGGATSLMRKADYAYNHLVLASRPGECRAFRRKMNVIANYFKIRTPDSLQAYAYRVEFKTKGRQGYETVTKKEKCEPLFWALYREQRRLFPASVYRIVFDGVGMIYSLDPIPLRGGEEDFTFSAEPPKPEPARAPQGNSNGGGYGGRGGYGGGGRGGGRPRAPAMAQAYITVVPMIKTDTFMVSDEVTRCALIQLLDLIITQEMRCPLLQDNSKFVTTGHSIFRVPDSDDDRHTAVRRIGMGEEVWTGLHMAVKPDCPDSLYLNASTSGSIFHTPKLNLVTFYAEIVNGYTLNQDIDTSRLTIVQWQLNKLADILKGTKVRIYRKAHDDWVAKKFDKFSQQPASALYFNCEGRDVSVAEYFHNSNLALKFPHLPCLAFYNKITRQQSYIPMELATTSEEPRKYKGRLSDLQLNAFIKAVGMVPREKKALISNFMAPGGKYVGEGALMDEWGVEVEREMVAIDDALILPYPDIKWKNSTTSVNAVSAEYAICDTDNGAPRPRQMIESPSKPLAVVMVFVNGDGCPEMLDRRMTPEELNHAQTRVYDTSYRTHAELICNTLRGYSIDTLGPAYTFQYLLNDRGEMHLPRLRGIIDHWKNEIAGIGRKNGKDYAPLFMFVFPRRHEKFYAAIKYTCDVDKGVLSQCILKRTFEKMQGNALSNTSAQNVLLKIVAKAGGAVCRLDGNQFRNVGKITSVEEPTLVLGIDVSHPSREERMKALESGGILQGYAKQANQWGVSSRVQRLGQEETVNLTEPFRARIEEFHRKTGSIPKHFIVYRDGVSDTQFKKICYEETQALERAIESFALKKEQVTITYICAKKRHHTRFFAANPNEAVDLAGNTGANTPPGLLIEKTVTSRSTFDFFLQSHYGNLGTVAPTHYTVLRDDWAPSVSFWQTVVFAHCFGNSRCTRPLSIPVPLHYAHFAAKRAKNLFDHFRDFAAPDEYASSKEDLIREEMEHQAITLNPSLKAMNSLYFA